MAPAERTSDTDEALRLALQSQLSPTILRRLDEVREHRRSSIREILAQAIDFAWHVQMSGELDRRPESSENRTEQIPEPPNRYNGWHNYETWATNLWLTNEEGTYNFCRGLARRAVADAPTCEQAQSGIWTVDEAKTFLLADQLKSSVEDMNPLADKGSMFSDLLNAAISEVNWHEIADAFLDDIADSASVA